MVLFCMRLLIEFLNWWTDFIELAFDVHLEIFRPCFKEVLESISYVFLRYMILTGAK